MKSFEELVEEVYQNTAWRKEFIKYARLRAAGMDKIEGYIKDFPQLYVSPITYNTYYETTFIKPDLYIERDELNKNLIYLSSALFKTLSHTYTLKANEIRKLREAVADRYEQKLSGVK